MRYTERLALLEKIGSELQRQYTFRDVDAFFAALAIKTAGFEHGGSKRLYAKEVLHDATDDVLLNVAEELSLELSRAAAIEPPANWRGVNQFRLFAHQREQGRRNATEAGPCRSRDPGVRCP